MDLWVKIPLDDGTYWQVPWDMLDERSKAWALMNSRLAEHCVPQTTPTVVNSEAK